MGAGLHRRRDSWCARAADAACHSTQSGCSHRQARHPPHCRCRLAAAQSSSWCGYCCCGGGMSIKDGRGSATVALEATAADACCCASADRCTDSACPPAPSRGCAACWRASAEPRAVRPPPPLAALLSLGRCPAVNEAGGIACTMSRPVPRATVSIGGRSGRTVGMAVESYVLIVFGRLL